MLPQVLLLLLATARSQPITDPTTTETTNQTEDPSTYEGAIDIVSYVQHFKNSMTEYVKSQYSNLTITETEQIKELLEQFLTTFAKDLRKSIEKQHKSSLSSEDETKTVILDGVPDETFADIKNTVRTEFPDVNEDTADEIVYKLRKNLFNTRQKLDVIINNSKRAHYELND